MIVDQMKGEDVMLKPVPFANASTVVGVAVYAVCRVLAFAMPNFLFSIGQSWFHTFSMDAMRVSASVGLGSFLFGAITLAVLIWISIFTAVALYNRWAK